ncbi:MAG: hypothetical protein KDD44_09310 [Bdellovibrionales bacterium]|nr:hypothetical protein [Bdellovibrionales bacterium]
MTANHLSQLAPWPPADLPAIQTLEAVDAAFMVVDSTMQPCYLSPRACRLLEIEDRSQYRSYANRFHELLNLTSTFARRSPSCPVAAGGKNPSIRRLRFSLGAGRGAEVVAQVQAISGPLWQLSEDDLAYLVLIRDVHYVSFLESSLMHHRKLRPLIVWSAASMGAATLTSRSSVESWVERSLERDRESNGDGSQTFVADFTAVLADALRIADELIPPTIRVRVDAPVSVLVRAQPLALVRLLAHLVLEAADFDGLQGEVRIKTAIPPRAPSDTAPRDRHVDVVICGERAPTMLDNAPHIDRYLAHHYLAAPKKVTVADGDPALQKLANGERTFERLTDNEQLLHRVPECSSLSPEALSNNARIADALSLFCGADLFFRRPTEDVFLMHLLLPLSESPVLAQSQAN